MKKRIFIMICLVAMWAMESMAQASYFVTLKEGSIPEGADYKLSALFPGETEYEDITESLKEEGMAVLFAGATVKFEVIPATGSAVSNVTAETYIETWQMQARRRSDGTSLGIDVTLTKGEGNTWTFTMPEANVELGVLWSKAVDASWITLNKNSFEYTGSGIEPEVTVNDGENDLTDYFTVSYSNNKNVMQAGSANSPTVTVTANADQTVYAGSASVTFAITPKPVTVTAAVKTREYDGTPDAEIDADNCSVNGICGTDDVTMDVSAATGRYADADAGENKTVVISGIALGGAQAGNYSLSSQPSGVTGTISPRSLTITTSSDSKKYDGTPLTNNEVTIEGLVEGEEISVTVTGSQLEVGESSNTYTIEWTTAKESNYTVTPVLGTLKVEENLLYDVNVPDITVKYDGRAYGVVFNRPLPVGANLKYGTASGTYDLDCSPTITTPGSMTVYWMVTATGYDPIEGQTTITVEPAPVTVSGGITVTKKISEVDGVSKTTYEGNCENAVLEGVIQGESVSLSGVTGGSEYHNDDELIWTNLNYASATLAGKDAGNYVFDKTNTQNQSVANVTETVDFTETNTALTGGGSQVDTHEVHVDLVSGTTTETYKTILTNADGTIVEEKTIVEKTKADGSSETAIRETKTSAQGEYTGTTIEKKDAQDNVIDRSINASLSTSNGSQIILNGTLVKPSADAPTLGSAGDDYLSLNAEGKAFVGGISDAELAVGKAGASNVMLTTVTEKTSAAAPATTKSGICVDQALQTTQVAMLGLSAGSTMRFGCKPDPSLAMKNSIFVFPPTNNNRGHVYANGRFVVRLTVEYSGRRATGDASNVPEGYIEIEPGVDYVVKEDCDLILTIDTKEAGIMITGIGVTPPSDVVEGNNTLQKNGDYYVVNLDESGSIVNPLDIGEGGTIINVTYNRKLEGPFPSSSDKEIDGKPAKLYTLCLPCVPKTANGVTFYTLSGASASTLTFSEVATDALAVNTPYLVAITGNFDIDEGCTNQAVESSVINSTTVDGFTFTGIFAGLTNAQAAGKYILQPGAIWGLVPSGNASVFVPPFRAYIEASASGARLLDSSFGDDATSIRNIRTVDADGTERWYDLNGRRIERPTQQGVYIHNGRKEVLK